MEISHFEECGVVVVADFRKFLLSQIQKYNTHNFQIGFDKGGEKSATSTKLTLHPQHTQSPHDCTVIGLYYATDCYPNLRLVFGHIFECVSSLDGTVYEGKTIRLFLDSDGPAKALVEGHNGSAKAKHFCLLCMCALPQVPWLDRQSPKTT